MIYIYTYIYTILNIYTSKIQNSPSTESFSASPKKGIEMQSRHVRIDQPPVGSYVGNHDFALCLESVAGGGGVARCEGPQSLRLPLR